MHFTPTAACPVPCTMHLFCTLVLFRLALSRRLFLPLKDSRVVGRDVLSAGSAPPTSRVPPIAIMFALCACAASLVLQDGRAARVMKDDAAIARFIQSRVVELANAAIASKGAFSMSIGSGTTVAPLIELAGEVDFTRVHLFFGNERTEGEAAGKCFDGAAQFVEACGVGHVYRVPSLAAAEAAVQYEAAVRAL